MDYNRDAYRAFPTPNSIDSMAAHSWQVIKPTTLSTNYGHNAIVFPGSEPAQCSEAGVCFRESNNSVYVTGKSTIPSGNCNGW